MPLYRGAEQREDCLNAFCRASSASPQRNNECTEQERSNPASEQNSTFFFPSSFFPNSKVASRSWNCIRGIQACVAREISQGCTEENLGRNGKALEGSTSALARCGDEGLLNKNN